MPAVLDEQMVVAPPTVAVFLSRRSELRLVKKPERAKRNAEGDVFEVIPGERVVFADGQLRVPLTRNGRMRGEKGEVLDAHHILAWLETHRANGDREEGFWRLEEPAPPPTEAEQNTLANLGMDLDVEGLERFIAQEQEGWKRKELLGVARSQLERAQEKLAKAAPAPAQPVETRTASEK